MKIITETDLTTEILIMLPEFPISDEMIELMRELITDADHYLTMIGDTTEIMNARATQYKIIEPKLIKLRKMIGKGKIGKKIINEITDRLISDYDRYHN